MLCVWSIPPARRNAITETASLPVVQASLMERYVLGGAKRLSHHARMLYVSLVLSPSLQMLLAITA